jgi:hypothetical protein
VQGLNNKITETLILFDNVLHKFQELDAFLQRLNNQIRAYKVKSKGGVLSSNPNTTLQPLPIT